MFCNTMQSDWMLDLDELASSMQASVMAEQQVLWAHEPVTSHHLNLQITG